MFFRKSKSKTISTAGSSQTEQASPSTNVSSTTKDKIIPEVSTISHGLKVTGSILSKGKVHFNGVIKGTLEAKSLYVGEDGFIDGKAIADEAVILGNIKGSLKGKKVRLASTSRIEGDTFHEVIAIEDGAIYEGSIKRIKS